jgi:methylenetetrahydrofolate dehydrogenase (NADP+)/methenyltetrahydrofolate cyclohydrolase
VSAEILDGKGLARRVRKGLKERAAELAEKHGRPPGLAVVLVGDDPASAIYVGKKEKLATKIGYRSWVERMTADTAQSDLEGKLRALAEDDAVDGILLQLPLPKGLDTDAALACIPVEKDVDGLTHASQARCFLDEPGLRPCTPKGVVRMLEDAGFEFSGARALVIGRSRLVGKPLATMLTGKNCTVTLAHSRTKDLAGEARRADLVCAAVGKAELVRGDWLKPGAWVVDVGIHRKDDGSLCGDVAFEEASEVAARLSPVPGGVGPMTIAMLLENTAEAMERRVTEVSGP